MANRWVEQLENHPIHDTLDWLEDCASTEFNDLEEEEIAEKRRFLKLVSLFKSVVADLDPEILPFPQLDGINNGLRHQNLSSQIEAYKSNGDVAHLKQANDLATKQLGSLCMLISVSAEKSYFRPINGLEKLIDSLESSIVQKKDSLVKQISEIEASSQEKQAKLDSLSELIDRRKTEVDSHLTEWQQQFSNSQEKRSQDFNQWREQFTNESSKSIDEITEQKKTNLSEINDEFRSELESILVDGKAKHQSILELYELTAGDSVGAGYIKNADQEKKQADIWRFVSVGFIALTVFWLLFAYNKNFEQTKTLLNISVDPTISATKSKQNSQPIQDREAANSEQSNTKAVISKSQNTISTNESNQNTIRDWFRLFSTVSISGVLLWGSAYSAQQSTKHRINEKKTRWFALEVKAIDPFISSLEKEQQNEIKRQLCQRIFGQSASINEDNPKVIDEHAFKTVTDTITKILAKIPK